MWVCLQLCGFVRPFRLPELGGLQLQELSGLEVRRIAGIHAQGSKR